LEVLSELHLLTQFDQDSKPYLPGILAGQSPLIDQMVFRTSTRSLSGSSPVITSKAMIASKWPTTWPLALAGLKTNPLEEAAITGMQQGSGGLFRKTNLLARGALIAAAQQSLVVTADHVRLAATEIF
jgi:general secretion pathway protein A